MPSNLQAPRKRINQPYLALTSPTLLHPNTWPPYRSPEEKKNNKAKKAKPGHPGPYPSTPPTTPPGGQSVALSLQGSSRLGHHRLAGELAACGLALANVAANGALVCSCKWLQMVWRGNKKYKLELIMSILDSFWIRLTGFWVLSIAIRT